MTKSSKIKSYSELYIKRRKETLLDFIDHYDYTAYEKATDIAIETHQKQLEEYIGIYEQVDKKIDNNYAKVGHYENEKHHYLISKLLFYEEKVNQNQAYLDSLYEMKVIYLYRSLELNINYLIETAYPTVNTKSLYRIDVIKSFFDHKEIDISKIEGYEEYQDLRKVTNCIKHNSKISSNVAKIPKFKKKEFLDSETLHEFYNRIKLKVQLFIRELKNEIKTDLFHFPKARLNKLVKEYYEQMDEETYLRFIEKMKQKAT